MWCRFVLRRAPAGRTRQSPGSAQLGTDEAVKAASETPFTLKEGTNYVIEFTFRVQRDVVLALKFFNLVYKMGVRVDKQTHVIGSFAPAPEPHVFALDPMVAPSGMLARGKYRTRSKFVDDDGTVHLDFEYLLRASRSPGAGATPLTRPVPRPPPDIKKNWD